MFQVAIRKELAPNPAQSCLRTASSFVGIDAATVYIVHVHVLLSGLWYTDSPRASLAGATRATLTPDWVTDPFRVHYSLNHPMLKSATVFF